MAILLAAIALLPGARLPGEGPRPQPKPATPGWAKRGYAHLFNETILQADEGCDFDFMTGKGKG